MGEQATRAVSKWCGPVFWCVVSKSGHDLISYCIANIQFL